MADADYTPDPAGDRARLAEASKSPEDFWLVYRTLMARYDSSCRVAHMTTFADEVAALAVSALAATGRLVDPNAKTRTEYGVRLTWDDGTVADDECDRKLAEGRVRWHAERQAAVPGWRVTAAEVVTRVRTTTVGPWLPAPTTGTEDAP